MNANTTMTTKQAAESLGLSRVRCLGLAKQGKLVASHGKIPGTEITQVLFDRASVESYVPTRSSTNRAMVVKLPTTDVAKLTQFCESNGWTLKLKNAKHPEGIVIDMNDEMDAEDAETA
jgi:hypothetical protein